LIGILHFTELNGAASRTLQLLKMTYPLESSTCSLLRFGGEKSKEVCVRFIAGKTLLVFSLNNLFFCSRKIAIEITVYKEEADYRYVPSLHLFFW
jgi:hypothetical protein